MAEEVSGLLSTPSSHNMGFHWHCNVGVSSNNAKNKANEILNAGYIVHRLFPVYYSTSRVAIEVNIGSTFKLVFPQNLYKLIDALLAA